MKRSANIGFEELPLPGLDQPHPASLRIGIKQCAATDDQIMLEAIFSPDGISRAQAISEKLMSQFDDFGAILCAPAESLRKHGLTSNEIRKLQLIERAALHLTRHRVQNRDVISSWNALLNYCRARIVRSTVERLHVLFLNRQNRLIADEIQQSGTVDHVPVYPRQIAKRALELNASAVIIVHNHPSGDPTPSKSDIHVTQQVSAALATLDIKLHDHIILGADSEVSLRSTGAI